MKFSLPKFHVMIAVCFVGPALFSQDTACQAEEIADGNNGEVVYNVFTTPNCQATTNQIGNKENGNIRTGPGFTGSNSGGSVHSTVMENTPQPVGYCQNHGIGASLYNSIEVLGCTDTCLCFRQVAADTADANCNVDKAVGYNVKLACFDQCLLDCNGLNCQDTTGPEQAFTRLMLTGEGPICDTPVAPEDFVCETTGMILDENGDVASEDVLVLKSNNTKGLSNSDNDQEIGIDSIIEADGGSFSAAYTTNKSSTYFLTAISFFVYFWGSVTY